MCGVVCVAVYIAVRRSALQCVAVHVAHLIEWSLAVCCSVLQCVAVCCSVLQCMLHTLSSGALQSVAECCSVFCRVLQCVAVCCSVLSCMLHTLSSGALAVSTSACICTCMSCHVCCRVCYNARCSALQCVAVCCNTCCSAYCTPARANPWQSLTCVAVRCSVLQRVLQCVLHTCSSRALAVSNSSCFDTSNSNVSYGVMTPPRPLLSLPPPLPPWVLRNATWLMILLASRSVQVCVGCQKVLCTLLQHTCNISHSASHCNILQHTATHCNTLQHTATH